MPNAAQKTKRSQRVAALKLPPGHLRRTAALLRREDVLARVGVFLAAAVVMSLVVHPWFPSLPYRIGYVPPRDITARVAFERINHQKTLEARELARRGSPLVYDQDPEPLRRLRELLRHTVVELSNAATFSEVNQEKWQDFVPRAADGSLPGREQQEELFERFREHLAGQDKLDLFDAAVAKSFSDMEQRGLLDKFENPGGGVNQEVAEIRVRPIAAPEKWQLVKVRDVLVGNEANALKTALSANLVNESVAGPVFNWLKSRLPATTLTYNEEATHQVSQAAAEAVKQVVDQYTPGQVLALAGEPLTQVQIDLLQTERAATFGTPLSWPIVNRTLVVLGMAVAMCGLWAYYLFRREPDLLASLPRCAVLLALAATALTLASLMSADPWRAEMIPLLLLGMTVAIAYRPELALVVSISICALLATTGQHSTGGFGLLTGTVVVAVLLLGRIRSRSKLIQVGLAAAVVAFLLTIGAGVLDEQPLDRPLLELAARHALWTCVAGFLITGLLPFVERAFGVLTDLSLLELGDVAHPLLQELVRRAPGTYNHSINVAAVAEAAAETIGVRGLLVRVGAYFHDIGKMLKPNYFVENQSKDDNRHDSLVPTMSTLIIIAHIKDGADLARQHRLPQQIIDFIEQHHGTTLVEYFYQRASRQKEANPDSSEVEETAFRYPGPKPQTKEAGVLMLADAAESACRTLVEPTPARIEAVIEEITRKRLLDGQFDECDLTLEQVRRVQESMVKSVTAVYHGRVKYPDQQTA